MRAADVFSLVWDLHVHDCFSLINNIDRIKKYNDVLPDDVTFGIAQAAEHLKEHLKEHLQKQL